MDRRRFTERMTAVVGLALIGMSSARAQGAPVEGKNYVKLSQAAPVNSPGKVEVIEFFWYGCPHCSSLEPALEQWLQKLPADVSFRRVPVAFSALHETHQRLFYALEAMGQLPALHRKVFAAIHVDHNRLDKEADIVAFVNANGADGAKFAELYKSFTVQAKARQAKQLAEAYRIDGVPALGVQGRYYTSVGMAGGQGRLFAVTDYLIDQARSQR